MVRRTTGASDAKNYLRGGIRFLRSTFDLPFYADLLQIRRQHHKQYVSYRVPLQQSWFNVGNSAETLLSDLSEIHRVLADALLWTNLGEVHFAFENGAQQSAPSAGETPPAADLILTAHIGDTERVLDTFKAAMVLVLAVQIGLAASLREDLIRHGRVQLPFSARMGEAIASVLQTAADPTLMSLTDISEHYVHSWCTECMHFRSTSTLPDSGFCEWAQMPIHEFLSTARYQQNPLWRVFVTHPHLLTALYNAEEREEATLQYRDRVAQWFDEEDQVTLDPITLHLIEDVLHAAKTEDELQDTDTVLPRALRLMDYWHAGYLPPSGESHPENPTLVAALDKLPDPVLPLVLSCLTLLPPQFNCIGFIPNDIIETEIGSLLLGAKPLRDVLIQAIPRRVLELLASSFATEGESINAQFMLYLREQVNVSFERIVLDYEVSPAAWLFEPMNVHLPDVLYIQARLNSFIRDVTLEAIRRINAAEER